MGVEEEKCGECLDHCRTQEQTRTAAARRMSSMVQAGNRKQDPSCTWKILIGWRNEKISSMHLFASRLGEMAHVDFLQISRQCWSGFRPAGLFLLGSMLPRTFNSPPKVELQNTELFLSLREADQLD